jgi:hypothetical protein
MGQFFASLSKAVLAFILIAGGILLIILFQPPHTVCESQIEVINESQRKFLSQDSKHPAITTTQYERMRDTCKTTNDPGGCYELFHALQTMLHDLGSLTSECAPAVASLPQYKRALWETAELMVRLAWGEKPPRAIAVKKGWLDAADLSLFCGVKARIATFYGASEWENFRERMMNELPGAKDLARNEVWDLSLFSENCARYP